MATQPQGGSRVPVPAIPGGTPTRVSNPRDTLRLVQEVIVDRRLRRIVDEKVRLLKSQIAPLLRRARVVYLSVVAVRGRAVLCVYLDPDSVTTAMLKGNVSLRFTAKDTAAHQRRASHSIVMHAYYPDEPLSFTIGGRPYPCN